MSGGTGTAVRDKEGDRVEFVGWDGLNEYEQMAAKAFEEGIENTLAHDLAENERLRKANERLRKANERLRKALDWLLHETMYKDHPAASQNAMDVLGIGSKPQGPVL